MAAEAPYGSKAWRDQKAAAQRRLDECLRVMADHEFENQNEIISCAGVLAKVYADKEFRHRYSSIVEVIEGFDHPAVDEGEARERINRFNSEIEQEQVRATCLASNLRQFLVYDHDGTYAFENDGDILELQKDRRLEKPYDHVALEAKRAGYNSGRMRMVVGEIGRADKSLRQSKKELGKTKDALKSAEKAAIKAESKAKRMQTELIGILGIFSAITLAFNAGVSFTTSSIGATTSNTSIFQIAFIVSVVGFFLFNTLYAAFSFIYRLVQGPSGDGKQFCQTKVIVICEAASIILMALFGVLSYLSCCTPAAN